MFRCNTIFFGSSTAAAAARGFASKRIWSEPPTRVRPHPRKSLASLTKAQRDTKLRYANGFSIFSSIAWRLAPIVRLRCQAARNRVIHLAWNNLDEKKRARFIRAAHRMRHHVMKPEPPRRAGRPKEFRNFVRDHSQEEKFARLPFQRRLAALSRAWRAQIYSRQ